MRLGRVRLGRVDRLAGVVGGRIGPLDLLDRHRDGEARRLVVQPVPVDEEVVGPPRERALRVRTQQEAGVVIQTVVVAAGRHCGSGLAGRRSSAQVCDQIGRPAQLRVVPRSHVDLHVVLRERQVDLVDHVLPVAAARGAVGRRVVVVDRRQRGAIHLSGGRGRLTGLDGQLDRVDTLTGVVVRPQRERRQLDLHLEQAGRGGVEAVDDDVVGTGLEPLDLQAGRLVGASQLLVHVVAGAAPQAEYGVAQHAFDAARTYLGHEADRLVDGEDVDHVSCALDVLARHTRTGIRVGVRRANALVRQRAVRVAAHDGVVVLEVGVEQAAEVELAAVLVRADVRQVVQAFLRVRRTVGVDDLTRVVGGRVFDRRCGDVQHELAVPVGPGAVDDHVVAAGGVGVVRLHVRGTVVATEQLVGQRAAGSVRRAAHEEDRWEVRPQVEDHGRRYRQVEVVDHVGAILVRDAAAVGGLDVLAVVGGADDRAVEHALPVVEQRDGCRVGAAVVVPALARRRSPLDLQREVALVVGLQAVHDHVVGARIERVDVDLIAVEDPLGAEDLGAVAADVSLQVEAVVEVGEQLGAQAVPLDRGVGEDHVGCLGVRNATAQRGEVVLRRQRRAVYLAPGVHRPAELGGCLRRHRVLLFAHVVGGPLDVLHDGDEVQVEAAAHVRVGRVDDQVVDARVEVDEVDRVVGGRTVDPVDHLRRIERVVAPAGEREHRIEVGVEVDEDVGGQLRQHEAVDRVVAGQWVAVAADDARLLGVAVGYVLACDAAGVGLDLARAVQVLLEHQLDGVAAVVAGRRGVGVGALQVEHEVAVGQRIGSLDPERVVALGQALLEQELWSEALAERAGRDLEPRTGVGQHQATLEALGAEPGGEAALLRRSRELVDRVRPALGPLDALDALRRGRRLVGARPLREVAELRGVAVVSHVPPLREREELRDRVAVVALALRAELAALDAAVAVVG